MRFPTSALFAKGNAIELLEKEGIRVCPLRSNDDSEQRAAAIKAGKFVLNEPRNDQVIKKHGLDVCVIDPTSLQEKLGREEYVLFAGVINACHRNVPPFLVDLMPEEIQRTFATIAGKIIEKMGNDRQEQGATRSFR